MKDRLKEILLSKNLTAAMFAEKIDVQKSSISHILSGRNKPGFDLISKILRSYPDIDPRWLILGEGSISKTNNPIDTNNKTDSNDLFSRENTNNFNNDSPKPKNQSERDIEVTKENSWKNTTVNSNQITNVNQAEVINSNECTSCELEKIVFFYKDGTFKVYNSK